MTEVPDQSEVGIVLFVGGSAPDDLQAEILTDTLNLDKARTTTLVANLYDFGFVVLKRLPKKQADTCIALAEDKAEQAGHTIVLRAVANPEPLEGNADESEPLHPLVNMLFGVGIFLWLATPLFLIGYGLISWAF